MSSNLMNFQQLTKYLSLYRLGFSKNMIKFRDDLLDSPDISDSSSDGSVDSQYPGITSNNFIKKCSCAMSGNSYHCSAIFKEQKKSCLIRGFYWTE